MPHLSRNGTTNRGSAASAVSASEWDVFLSHVQSTGGDQCLVLRQALSAAGLRVWFDQDCTPTVEGMREGVHHSRVFVSFISTGVFTRWAVQNEVREALRAQSPIVFVLYSDAHGEPSTSPDWEVRRALELNKDGDEGVNRVLQRLSHEARLQRAEAIVFHRGQLFEEETLPTLLTALFEAAAKRSLGRERGHAGELSMFTRPRRSDSSAALVFKLPRPGLPSPTHAHVLIACGARGVDKARFFALALQQACPRLVVRVLGTGPAALGAEAVATTTRAVIALLTLDTWENAAAYGAVSAALQEVRTPTAPPRIKLLALHDPDANRGGSADFGGFLSAQPPAPPGFFADVMSEQFERRSSKRAAMLHGLLAAVGAHAADGESGPFAPPRLPAYYSEAPLHTPLAAVVAALTTAAPITPAASGERALEATLAGSSAARAESSADGTVDSAAGAAAGDAASHAGVGAAGDGLTLWPLHCLRLHQALVVCLGHHVARARQRRWCCREDYWQCIWRRWCIWQPCAGLVPAHPHYWRDCPLHHGFGNPCDCRNASSVH